MNIFEEKRMTLQGDSRDAESAIELALIFAAMDNNTELGLDLISAGANLDLQDKDGDTALIFAAQENNTELGLALISGGANLDLQNNDGATALTWAAYKNNSELAIIALQLN